MASAGTPNPNFPTSLDTTDTFNSTDSRFTIVLSAWLTKFWRAIIAIETIIGVTASVVTTTITYKLGLITGSDQAIGASSTTTVLNKKLSDTTTTVVAAADTTKGFRWSIGGTTAIVGFFATAFTTAKTITFPDATDTLMGKATTDTMTNKTYDTAGTGNVFRINGTAISAVTGSGAAVLATNPTLAGATMSASLNEAKGTDIASAGTTNIGAATGNYVNITGTTTITAFDTVQAGTRRILQFSGALTLTHNATSLILPTALNITTVAGDTAVFVSLGAGNWKCVNYMRASGQPLASSSARYESTGVSTLTTGTTNITHGLGTTPTKLRFEANFVMVNGWASDQITRTSGVAIVSGGTITAGAAVSYSQDAAHTFNTGGQSMTSTTAGRVLLNAKFSDTYLTVSAVTSTQFTLTWTLANHGGTNDTIGNIAILWEASA